jgi:hypothetical protein
MPDGNTLCYCSVTVRSGYHFPCSTLGVVYGSAALWWRASPALSTHCASNLGCLVNRPARWTLSSLDWYAHAVNEYAERPYGVWVARCRHRLLTVTVLHHNRPSRICARWTLR